MMIKITNTPDAILQQVYILLLCAHKYSHKVSIGLKQNFQLRYEFQDNHLSCAAGLRNAKPLQSSTAQCVSF